MRSNFLILFAFSSLLSFAQPNTEVFLFDLNTEKDNFLLSNFKNISNNEGYDNQPSFMDNETLLYAGTRNGQTDIVKYDLNYGSTTWICFTEGGEYSPSKIPNQNAVSAIRLDLDGKQRLYRYNLKTTTNTVILDTLVVGYHVWFDQNTLVSSVLENDFLSLYISDLKTLQNKKITTHAGRSLHNIPNSNLISFISKNPNGPPEIKSLDPANGIIKTIARTLPNVEDMCWMPDGRILMTKDDAIFQFYSRGQYGWVEVASLKDFGITNLTRLAVSPDGKKLVIVGELSSTTITEKTPTNSPSPMSETQAAAIVQKHIEPYNNGSLDFVDAFDENVIVNNFPSQKLYEGRQKMRDNYTRFFKNNSNLSVTVNNRMAHGNIIIEEELASVNQSIHRQVTIYQTGDDTIKSMTFIPNSESASSPEFIVNKQLEAYNARNIDAFVNTYSQDIKLYNFPDTLTSEGSESLRKSYTSLFESTPDLRATIKSRMIIGNKVIDKEEVLINGKTYHAIAIYEVNNGKIAKVTFIQ